MNCTLPVANYTLRFANILRISSFKTEMEKVFNVKTVGIKMGECKVIGKLRQCYVSTPVIVVMPNERCCLPDVARKHSKLRL